MTPLKNRPTSLFCTMLLLISTAVTLGQDDAKKESPEANKVAREFNAAYQAKDYPKALELGRKLAELDPTSAEVAYNLACVHCLSQDKIACIDWLRKSIDLGMDDLSLISTDADLAPIRDDPAFTACIEGVRKNREKSFGELKKRLAEIKPLIVVPENLDKGKPAGLIVTLHGFGDREDVIAERWRDIAEEFGAIIVSPRGPHSTRDGGFHWGDVEDADYVVGLALDRVKKQHKIDPGRIIITGFSQGGHMAINIASRHTDTYCGVIPIAGTYQPALARIHPSTFVKKPKFYLIVGDKDPVLDTNRQAAKDLEAVGAPVMLNIVDRTGHTFPDNRVIELRKAMRFVLEK